MNSFFDSIIIAKYKPFENLQSALLSTILISRLSGGRQQ